MGQVWDRAVRVRVVSVVDDLRVRIRFEDPILRRPGLVEIRERVYHAGLPRVRKAEPREEGALIPDADTIAARLTVLRGAREKAPSLTVGDLLEGLWPERRRAVGAGRVHAVDTAVLVARPVALRERAERGAERQAQRRDDAGQ